MAAKLRNRTRIESWPIAVLVLTLGTAAGLCAFQFGDRHGMNSMPYAQVRAFAQDLDKAQKMAREGNIELLAGQSVEGKPVQVRGELTDANCFLGKHEHAYDHAFCAKLCVAAGSPMVFVADEGGIYLVLTPQNAKTIPNATLDQIGIPGVLVNGRVVEGNGVKALAVDGIQK